MNTDEILKSLSTQIINLVSFFETDIRSNQRIFDIYKNTVNDNHKINFSRGARFHLWVERNHYYALYAGLRRIFFGRDNDEISLLNILDELLVKSAVITKHSYGGFLKVPDNYIGRSTLGSASEGFFEVDGRLNVHTILQDRASILKIKKDLKFINSTILHIQKNKNALIPDNEKIATSLESLGVLLKRYELFLTGNHVEWAIPNLAWVDIFTYPWITQE